MWAEHLLQALGEGVVVLDADEQIVYFSAGAERILRWTDAVGRSFTDVFRPAEQTSLLLADYISPAQRRMNVLTQNEQPVMLAVTGVHFSPTEGEPLQVALILRDITDEASEQHLHSYFLANISHEFRTPLAGLNASIELLLDEAGYLSAAEMDELLNSIYLSASGLQALVDNLLESVKIEAGHFVVHPRPLAINGVIAGAVRLMQPLLDRRKQALSVTEPLQLPLVHADPTRLTQVFINLLSNASKYSPMNSTIDLALEQQNATLWIAVTDRGPGIAPADRAAVFRRFVRLGISTREQEGIGLGLSVVKAIVEQHHGQVGVEDRPGGGSVFWFTLPLVEVP